MPSPLTLLIAAPIVLAHQAVALPSHRKSGIDRLVFFGDSFTDQSRSHSISNGSYPDKNYQEVFPPADVAPNGGISWPYYLGLYTGLEYDNYAVGGAACSNVLTPMTVPSVSGGQLAWFVEDHVLANSASTKHPAILDIDGRSTLAIVWIGTNDLGIHALLAPDNFTAPYAPAIPPLAPGQDNATTINDLANCQLGQVQTLYNDYGIKNFMVLSTIPLHLTALYAANDSGTIYWPETHDGKAWNLNMYHMENALNGLVSNGLEKLDAILPGASVSFFDTYKFFEELYLYPEKYYNGSIAPSVTGHCHQCPNASDWRYCGIGDCTESERDSYMFWDELHPSEQTGRLLAAEIKKKMEGRSEY